MVDLSALGSAQYQQALASSQTQTQSFNASVGSLSQNLGPLGKAFSLVTVPVALLTKGLGGYGSAAQEAQDRTLPLKATAAVTGQSFSLLAAQAEGLSRKLPITANAAAQTVIQVQALGISGVGSEARIGKLATTVTKLGAATGESVGIITPALANVQRAFGDENLDPSRVQKMADVVTTLTDKVGGSATGILSFASAIGPFARQAGIGEAATLGISAAFSKLGDDGTSAATAVNRVLADVNKSIRDGGGNISVYANLLGQTNTEFLALAKNNPTQTLEKVLNSLGNGAQGARALDSLGLDSVRTQTALTALGQSGGLQGAISTAIGAQGNGATDKASAAAFSGLSNQLQHLQNESEQVAEVFGGPVLSVLTAFAKVLAVPLGIFNALARNPIVKLLSELAAGFGLTVIALRTFTTGLTAARLIQRSTTRAVSRGGRLVGQADGDIDAAEANATSRRDLRAVQTYRSNREYQADREGYQQRADASNRIRNTSIYANRQGLTDRNGEAYDVAPRINRNGPQGSLTGINSFVGGYSERAAQLRTLQAAQGVADDGPGVVRRAAAAGVQGYRALRFTSATPFRIAAANSAGGQANADAANGAYAGFTDKLREATAAEDKATGTTRTLQERFEAVNALLREYGATLETSNKALLKGAAGGYTTTARARANVVVQAATSGLRDETGALSRSATASNLRSAASTGLSKVGGAASGLLGSVGGLATIGFVAGGAAISEIGKEKSEREQQTQDFLQTSITSGLDRYRDALGEAVTQTKTFSDTVSSASKAASTGEVTSAKAATDTGAGAAATALSQTAKVLTTFNKSASNSSLSAQINSISPNGFGNNLSDLGQIRNDLIRQVGATRAGQVLAGVNTNAPAVDATPSTGTVGGISRVVTDDANTGSALGKVGKALNFASGNLLESNRGGRNLADASKDTLNTLLGSIQTQSAAQTQAFSPQFARQQELRSFQEAGNAAASTGDKDEFTFLATRIDNLLGGKGKGNISASQVAGGQNFLQSLAVADPTLKNILSGVALTGPGVAATPQANSFSKAATNAGLVGSFADVFDNTKTTANERQVNNFLTSSPDDPAKQQAAISTTIASLKETGTSFASISGQAGKLVNSINDATDAQSVFATAIQARIAAAQTAGAASQSSGVTQGVAAQTLASQVANIDPTTQGGATALTAATPEISSTVTTVNQELAERLQAEQSYQKNELRGTYDYQLARQRAETDANTQIQRSREDLNVSIQRSQRDFDIQSARAAQQAATAAYAPFQRVQVQATTDGETLIANLKQQTGQLQAQAANLNKLRAQGVSNQTIQQLGLADASQAQEVSTLANNGRFDKKQASGLNNAVDQRLPAAATLFNDAGNLQQQEAIADRKRQQSDTLIDFNKNLKRQESDQALSFARQDTDRATELARSATDLEQGFETFSGSYTKLQGLFNKGLAATQDQFSSVMSDSLDTLIKKYGTSLSQLAKANNTIQNGGLPSVLVPPIASGKTTLHAYAYGGISLTPHLGLMAERGVPEAMIPLDQRGVTMLATAMERYLGRSLSGMNTTGAHRTYITDTSSHSYDYSTKVQGPITVKASTPNELGAALKAKKRAANLTAAPVGR